MHEHAFFRFSPKNFFAIKILLDIPIELRQIHLSQLTPEQIMIIHHKTNTKLIEDYQNYLKYRIDSSTYFPHYKYIFYSYNSENAYLTMSVPWIIKKFITQLRINPNHISTPSGQIIMSNNQVCELCSTGKMTWTHLLKFCKIVSRKTVKPPGFQIPRNSLEFYSHTIPGITLPEAWYLFRITKLLNTEPT